MRRLMSSKWKSRSCIWLLALMALMLMPSFMPSQTDVAGLEIPIYKASCRKPSSAALPIPCLIIMIPDSLTGWLGY